MRAPNLQRIRKYFDEEVANDVFLEIELLALAVAAGVDDAATFPDFRIFASNQTGNTVLIAVSALGLEGNIVVPSNVGFSLGVFILSAIVFGQLGEYVGKKKRGWLFCSNVLQTLIVFGAAASRRWYTDVTYPPHAWAQISLLAFQSGGQVAMARTVDVQEITTAMATSAYVDFMVDPQLFALHNRPRNRRFFFIACLLGGSFIGATAYREVHPAFALLLVALVKSLVCIMLLFNHSAPGKDRSDRTENSPTESSSPLEDGKECFEPGKAPQEYCEALRAKTEYLHALKDSKQYFEALQRRKDEYEDVEDAKQKSYRRYGILYGR